MKISIRTAKCGIVTFDEVQQVSMLLKNNVDVFISIDNSTINISDRLRKHILIWSNLHHHNTPVVSQLDWVTLLTVWLTSRLEFPNQYAFITDFNELLLKVREYDRGGVGCNYQLSNEQ